MSAISEEIDSIKAYVNTCLDTDAPLDTKKIKRLADLKRLRLEELVSTHTQRFEVMKTKTRELTSHLTFTPEQMSIASGTMDLLYAEIDKYDAAAIQWVNNPSLIIWEDSEAYAIAAGILILANEIC